MSKYLKVRLRYSAIAKELRQKQTLRGLGLRHRHQVRILKDTPAIRGLIKKVIHLVSFEETKEAHLPKKEKITTYRLGAVKPAAPKSAKAAVSVAEKQSAPVKKAASKKAGPAKKAHKK